MIQLSRRTLLLAGLATAAAPACAAQSRPERFTPRAFGAREGQNATDALNQMFREAARAGRRVDLSEPATYVVSRLVIPQGVRVVGAGVRFRGDDTARKDATWIAVERGARIEALTLTSPGRGGDYRMLTIDEGVEIGALDIQADVQTGTTGVISAGQDVHIGSFTSRRIDRPLHVKVDAARPATGFRLGRFEARNYIRALRLDYLNGFSIGALDVSERSPRASKHPGHNGILINGCQDGDFAPCRIADSGEHAIRIGGAQRKSARLRFAGVEAIRPGGCGFKINPNFQRFAAEDITIERLHGEDGGDPLSGNADLLRITHGRNIVVGELTAAARARPASCWTGLKLNDVNGLTVRRADIQGAMKSLLLIDEFSDGEPAGVYNVHVQSFRGSTVDASSFVAVEFETPTYAIGNIRLDDVDFRGDARNLFAVSNERIVRTTGPVSIRGRSDAARVIGLAPNAPVSIDVSGRRRAA